MDRCHVQNTDGYGLVHDERFQPNGPVWTVLYLIMLTAMHNHSISGTISSDI